jgi:cell division protein FtsL
MAPWSIMALIAVVGFLGLGFARTSLDRAAFELAELNAAIDEQHELNLELKLEIARLENPARIAPLAEEMGLVIPEFTHQLLVDLDGESPVVAGAEKDESSQ